MANKHGDFLWYELMTTDADAAQAFYGPLMGWDFADSGQQAMDYRLFSRAGTDIGGLLKLTADMTAGGARPLWAGYIAVDDVDATAGAIAASGGTILMPPQDIPGVGRFAYVADPTGAPFYIMRGSVEGGETQSFAKYEPREGYCAWNELASADPAAADAFYTGLFGWQKGDAMEMGPAGTYQMYRAGDYTLGAIMPKPATMPASLWSHYFRVPDIDAAVAFIRAHEGKTLIDPTEIPGGDLIISAIDPQGAMFSLIGKRGS